MFVGKARSFPYSVSFERDLTLVGSGLASKHLVRLEKLARDKHSTLLQFFLNYGRKNFITLGPGGCIIKHNGLEIYRFRSNLMCLQL